MNNKKARRNFIIACLSPALILFAIFMVYPTLNIFLMSMYRWGGLSANKMFVGIKNFELLLDDQLFIHAFQNTVLIIVLVTIITMSVAIIFASILVREKIKGQNFFRIIFYIPNILSVVVIAAIFSAIYDSQHGIINSTIALFQPENWESIKFLGNESIVIYSIILALVWQAIGYYMVMYMASMSTIPEHLYEAASLEGASKFTQFFRITLPMIWDNIRTTLTFFIISSMNLSFLIIQVMTSGGPNGASETLLSYMYKQAYNNAAFGYAMAIGVVVFLFSFALSGIVNFVTKREPLEL